MNDGNLGQRLRARREQMKMSRVELGELIDIPDEAIEIIEEGHRKPTIDESRSLCAYLGIGERYLAGEQSLSDVIAQDDADAESMMEVICKAFRALPHHTLRVVAFGEMKGLIVYKEWVSQFDGAEKFYERYA